MIISIIIRTKILLRVQGVLNRQYSRTTEVNQECPRHQTYAPQPLRRESGIRAGFKGPLTSLLNCLYMYEESLADSSSWFYLVQPPSDTFRLPSVPTLPCASSDPWCVQLLQHHSGYSISPFIRAKGELFTHSIELSINWKLFQFHRNNFVPANFPWFPIKATP